MEVNRALSTLFRSEIVTTGAGRTDTGVHARFFVAHFEVETPIAAPEKMTYKLNSILPKDISIRALYRVREDAHARFSATMRSYEYQLLRRKNPFLDHFAWYYPFPLDLHLMNQAAALLSEYSDFTSFSKLHGGSKTNTCKVLRAEWHIHDELLVFSISADRFLRNMVRAIVGTLLEVGRGKIDMGGFRSVIDNRDRAGAGISVPAKGLALTGIEYPLDVLFRE